MAEGVSDAQVERLARMVRASFAQDPSRHISPMYCNAARRLLEQGWTPPAEPDPAVEVARAFYEAYERLAPEFGYQTRSQSAVPWANVPENNKALMVATVRDLPPELVARLHDATNGGK